MIGQPWETPFHPENLIADFWTMMNPAWQAQLFDHDKVMETVRMLAASGVEPIEILRQQHALFDAALQANLLTVEVYTAFWRLVGDVIAAAVAEK